ncbi:hypothetical protein SVAN01_06813 [Stagonosporopsis vannaccii]|nr:hypothetical protein SVAN01_06813 [Stagonosporopsis vannaccii]
MPSPFHQKYSSQSHKVFGDNTVPAMPEVPKDDAQRRGSDASMTEPSSPNARRRSSAAQRFGNLEMLKRPNDPASTERRSSLQDAYGKSGFLGTMWNKLMRSSFTRGPANASPPAPKAAEPRDTTTLRG